MIPRHESCDIILVIFSKNRRANALLMADGRKVLRILVKLEYFAMNYMTPTNYMKKTASKFDEELDFRC